MTRACSTRLVCEKCFRSVPVDCCYDMLLLHNGVLTFRGEVTQITPPMRLNVGPFISLLMVGVRCACGGNTKTHW